MERVELHEVHVHEVPHARLRPAPQARIARAQPGDEQPRRQVVLQIRPVLDRRARLLVDVAVADLVVAPVAPAEVVHAVELGRVAGHELAHHRVEARARGPVRERAVDGVHARRQRARRWRIEHVGGDLRGAIERDHRFDRQPHAAGVLGGRLDGSPAKGLRGAHERDGVVLPEVLHDERHRPRGERALAPHAERDLEGRPTVLGDDTPACRRWPSPARGPSPRGERRSPSRAASCRGRCARSAGRP